MRTLSVTMLLVLVSVGRPADLSPRPANTDRKAEGKGPKVDSPLAEKWDYVAPMKKVAARFQGNEGVVIHVGASDTIANPYTTWARLGKGKTAEDEAVLKWMHANANDQTDGWWLCRHEVVSHRAYTAESGLESSWLFEGAEKVKGRWPGAPLPPLAKMLDDYKPRMVVLEVGIYEAEKEMPVADYRKNMARAFDLILERGAIPIPTTSPPIKAHLKASTGFNEALRELARARGLPLIDMEQEILQRRPDDWYGTLMTRMHLTAARAGVNPSSAPTADNLRESGFLLRGWVTVRKLAEVKRRVLDKKNQAAAERPKKLSEKGSDPLPNRVQSPPVEAKSTESQGV